VNDPVAERRRWARRRVWKLASLLSANAEDAEAVAAGVLATRRDLDVLEPARLDRLVVLEVRKRLQARGSRPGEGVAPGIVAAPDGVEGPAAEAHRVVFSMPEQQREAWLLNRIDGLELRRVARAMDCSKTAAERFLEAADQAIEGALGDEADGAVKTLRARLRAVGEGPAIERIEEGLETERRRRLAAKIAVVVFLVLLAGWVVAETLL